jgi:hypothetical protein
VYIIDLVAAGMQQQTDSRNGSSNNDIDSEDGNEGSSAAGADSAAADLVAGLAAVFVDPGCTLVVQDAGQVRRMQWDVPCHVC